MSDERDEELKLNSGRSMKANYSFRPTPDARFWDHQLGPWPLERDLVTLGAVLGLVGGPIAAAVGLLLLAINAATNLFMNANHANLQTAGSVLLVAIIPSLLLGGHCLDKLDKRIANGFRSWRLTRNNNK